MNVFVPQSIQSNIELAELVDVRLQLIKATSSTPIYGLIIDSLLASYVMTSGSMQIDWRDYMNLSASIKQDNFMKIKKDKQFSGNDLYSELIPENINYIKRDGDKVATEIVNGYVKVGPIGKDLLKAGKNGLSRFIMDEYSEIEAGNFLANCQRLSLNWNQYYGFSVDLGDTDVRPTIIKKRNEHIKTKLELVQKMITELENNPNLMDHNMLEGIVTSELDTVRDDVGDYIINDMTPTNRINIVVKSGATGDKTNICQISGVQGQVVIESIRPKKKVNNRPLPYFFQNDDTGPARGFVKHSFLEGFAWPEFVYHHMASREGLIDSSIKSVTGDTPIIIQEDGEIKQINIGDWIDKRLDNEAINVEHYTEQEMELLKIKNEVFIPTCDENGNVTWGEITAITRHDPGKELYEIITHGGRRVIVTESKSLLIWNDEEEKFLHTSTPDVIAGDFVPVTANLCKLDKTKEYINMVEYFSKDKYLYGTDFIKAKEMMTEAMVNRDKIPCGWWEENNGNSFTLPYNSKACFQRVQTRSDISCIMKDHIYPYSINRNCERLPEKFQLDTENGKFIGLFLAEGNVDFGSGYVQITNTNAAILKFTRKWFKKYNIKYSEVSKVNHISRTSTHIRGYSRMLATFLTQLVGHGAKNKYVLNDAFLASDDFIKGLISGYISGDGIITKNSIVVGSASERLIDGINMLLSRLGIFGKITKTILSANNVTDTPLPRYTIAIRSQWASKFRNIIDLIDSNKKIQIEEIIITRQTHWNFKLQNDVVLDKIVEINKIDVKKYPKVYDLTVPSTLNFGLANGLHVVDTAESGYVQRKLIKSMEDVLVRYDNTVRTSTGAIYQFIYGDNGIDSTKQYMHNFNIVNMGNQQLRDKYQFGDKRHDGKEYNDNKFYEMMLNIRTKFRDTIRRTKLNFITLDSQFYIPINITLIITNIKEHKQGSGKLTADYVMNKIEEILSPENTSLVAMKKSNMLDKNYVKYRDDQLSKQLFRAVLYETLAPKRCIEEYKFSKEQFDNVYDHIISSFKRSRAEPGEMVGIIAAQSMGEGTTQFSTSSLSEVIIYDKSKDKIYKGPIGEFIDKQLKKYKREVNKEEDIHILPVDKDSEFFDAMDWYIMGLNSDETVSWKRIEELSRHPANGDLMKVYTKSGRTVTTTVTHSFLRRTESSVEPIEGKKLKVGDQIPVSRNISMITKTKSIKVNDVKIKLTQDIGWLCGMYLGDGCLNGNRIIITKMSKEVETNLKRILEENDIGELAIRIKEGKFNTELVDKKYDKTYKSKDMSWHNKSFASFLKDNFGCGSFNKFVGSFVHKTNLEFIAGLISGYFDSDGNFNSSDGHHEIRVASRSQQLIEDMSLLINYFGMYGSVLTSKRRGDTNNFYWLAIQKKYAHVFRDQIGLRIEYKLESLNSICEYNDRVIKSSVKSLKEEIDVIPELIDIICYVSKQLKYPSRFYTNWAKYKTIGRSTLQKYISEFETKTADLEDEDLQAELVDKIAILKQAANSDVVWDKIVKIELIEDSDELVYDFSVPGTDSFMVNNGVIIHNTLKAFHSSGIASKGTTNLGVSRMKELLSYSKNLKTPKMYIYLSPNIMADESVANKIAHHMKHTTIEDIRSNIGIYYDPNPDDTNSLMNKDKVTRTFHNIGTDRDKCTTSYEKLPWLIRIVLDREKMFTKEVTLLDIKTKFCNEWEKKYQDIKALKREEKVILEKITNISVLSNYDNSPMPTIHIRFDMTQISISLMNRFIDDIIDKFKIKGIPDIDDININEERILTFNETTGEVEKKTNYVLYSAGINMLDIRNIHNIDINKTFCNSVAVIYEMFGIEAARQVLNYEFSTVFNAASNTINYQHMSILLDTMCNSGIITSIDRHGMNKLDSEPLASASFEKPVERLNNAAVFAETDNLKSISARVMAGLPIIGGTGFCNLILDTDLLERSEVVTNDYVENIVEESGLITNMVSKKKSKGFVPM